MTAPVWITEKIKKRKGTDDIVRLLRSLNLHTVCEEAKCPNLGECFRKGTATFLILGNICTRNCRFCAIKKGKPDKVDENEPLRVAQAVKKLGLDYAVITSVTRDDLQDGGASIFADTIREIRRIMQNTGIEVLTPDFKGDRNALNVVLNAKPDVFNHNVETVPSLYSKIRPIADYNRSLSVLKYAKEIAPEIFTKSGIMLGLGETIPEVKDVLYDLRENNVDMITIGQYLQPSSRHYPIQEYIHPDVFAALMEFAYSIGFGFVASAPLVRSSYNAKEGFFKMKNEKDKMKNNKDSSWPKADGRWRKD